MMLKDKEKIIVKYIMFEDKERTVSGNECLKTRQNEFAGALPKLTK